MEIGKIVTYEFWYDNVKPKYREKSKLSYKDTDSLIVSMKPEDILLDIAKDVETRSVISNYELDRPLSNRKSKTVIGLIKGKLGAKKMKEVGGLRARHV